MGSRKVRSPTRSSGIADARFYRHQMPFLSPNQQCPVALKG